MAVPCKFPIELVTAFADTQNGWVTCQPIPAMIEYAQDLRSERDKLWPDIYPEEDGDMKWTGELGELCVIAWLRSLGIAGKWHKGNPIDKPDVTTDDKSVRIGVKTVKRQVRMQEDYTAQISAKHRNENADWFFFLCYEQPWNQMVLLGAIKPADFLRTAKFYRAGQWVHPNYQVRGHDIYNGDVTPFIRPRKWADSNCI